MSAGGLSYSALSTNRRVTLPSVEMWNTNMNILKDPNKGVYTRRIDKVGDTQNILMEQDASGDRACEYIRVYQRGVNPMVSVSYDNFSNNGGQRGQKASFYDTQVRYPYRVETLRPPILRQEDLLPYSRMPRVWFHAETNPAFPQFKHDRSCAETPASTRSDILAPAGETARTIPSGGGGGLDAEAYTGHSNQTSLPKKSTAGPMRGPEMVKWDHSKVSGLNDGVLHADAITSRSTETIRRSHQSGTNAPTKEIDRNKRVYEAFTMRSMPHKGGGPSEMKDRLGVKSINPNMLYMKASTNNRIIGRDDPLLDQNAPLQASKEVHKMTHEGTVVLGDAAIESSDMIVPPTRSMMTHIRIDAPVSSRERTASPPDGVDTGVRADPLHYEVEGRRTVADRRAGVGVVSGSRDVRSETTVIPYTAPRAADRATGPVVWDRAAVIENPLHSDAAANPTRSDIYRAMEDDRTEGHIRINPRVQASAPARRTRESGGGQDPDVSFVSRPLDKTIPRFSLTAATSGATTREQQRADPIVLDRRAPLVRDAMTTRAAPGRSDLYDVQSTRAVVGERLPMESFLHNRSAMPMQQNEPGGIDSFIRGDDRSVIRDRAFRTMMERSGVPFPSA